ncbi:MAG: hypothetical protein FWB84_08260 [Candidatus Bathyarchaeota archaeon]|uniref:hypothetical protein n=1 Tax=Candidatus Bathycorpusculum sp. TaxID=2994959 RepID=UPI00281A7E51|nr:hypothetical protein [Candidatus Termiticorpusculum sp.]MCL2256809.1 hypothetical protein [Candidatus Termiticorpusculum sp.]MCL2293087.1 hypothetical protein [Candidatus Termiticorpusculum sp.]
MSEKMQSEVSKPVTKVVEMQTIKEDTLLKQKVELEKLEIEKKLVLEHLPLEKLKPLWPRLIISKKVVVIRSNVPNDAYTNQFSHAAATKVLAKAISAGWSVTDLDGNDANRTNVETKIGSADPDFIVHYDHGSAYALYGQDNNTIKPVLDTSNVSLFNGKATSTVSCESALGLGPLAVSTGAKAYIGYDELHWVHLWYIDDFIEAANAANYALLEGKTYEEAYELAIKKHNEIYDKLINIDTQAAALILHNRDHLQIIGNRFATATGIIIDLKRCMLRRPCCRRWVVPR